MGSQRPLAADFVFSRVVSRSLIWCYSIIIGNNATGGNGQAEISERQFAYSRSSSGKRRQNKSFPPEDVN